MYLHYRADTQSYVGCRYDTVNHTLRQKENFLPDKLNQNGCQHKIEDPWTFQNGLAYSWQSRQENVNPG